MLRQKIAKIVIAIFIVGSAILLTEVLISQKVCTYRHDSPREGLSKQVRTHEEVVHYLFTPNPTKEILNPAKEIPNPTKEIPNSTEEIPNSTEETPKPTEEIPELTKKPEKIEMFKFPVVASLSADAINITIKNEQLTAGLVSSNGSLGPAETIALPESSSDIFFTMKSIAKYHAPRLSLLLVTWLQTVDPLQVHIVTDSDSDPWIRAIQDRGIQVTVTTSCKSGHKVMASQCCKAGLQYKAYYMAAKVEKRKYRWFCHFDDDVYVNIVQLVRMLKQYDPTEKKLYLGHYPVNVWGPVYLKKDKRIHYGNFKNFPEAKKHSFTYATGASYCISSSLMDSLEKYLSGRNFHSTCNLLQVADDLAIGIIIDSVLGYQVTEVRTMMSEVQDLTQLRRDLREMITIGYHMKEVKLPVKYNYYLEKNNRVLVPDALFTEREDPSGFLSYHCLLYPSTSWCKTQRRLLHRRKTT